MPFLRYCETTLWQPWLNSKLHLSATLDGVFELDHLPEPYLYFGDKRSPLCWLTTNPGAGMRHQNRNVILGGQSLVSPDGTYADAATALADFYQQKLTGQAANRIKAMLRLAHASGYSGFLQLESFPFHSAHLPEKPRLLPLAEKDPLLIEYHHQLRQFLNPKTVLSLSAVHPKSEITPQIIRERDWLKWQAELMGFNTTAPRIIPLVNKGSRTTSAFIDEQTTKRLKGFLLMMGGQSPPALRITPAGRKTAPRDLTRFSPQRPPRSPR